MPEVCFDLLRKLSFQFL